MKRLCVVVLVVALFICQVASAQGINSKRYTVSSLNFDLPDSFSYTNEDEYGHYFYNAPDGKHSLMALCSFDEISYASEDIVNVVETFMDSFMGMDVKTEWTMIENAIAAKACCSDSEMYINAAIVAVDDGLYTFAVISDVSDSVLPNDDVFNAAVKSMSYGATLSPEWLAEEFSDVGTDSYISNAEYVEKGNYFLFSLQDTDVTSASWKMFSSSVREQLIGAFESIVLQIRTALDSIDCADTTLVCTYKLADGPAAVLLINGVDHSELVS